MILLHYLFKTLSKSTSKSSWALSMFSDLFTKFLPTIETLVDKDNSLWNNMSIHKETLQTMNSGHLNRISRERKRWKEGKGTSPLFRGGKVVFIEVLRIFPFSLHPYFKNICVIFKIFIISRPNIDLTIVGCIHSSQRSLVVSILLCWLAVFSIFQT